VGEPRFDVVAVGEVMGLLDPVDDGRLEDVSAFRLRVAGAEGNVLITLAHLGHTTALVTAVGGDPVGRLVTRTLGEHGVNLDHVRVDPSGRTGVFFKERFGGGERRVYYYRDGSAAARMSLAEVDLDRIGAPRVLTVSGVTLGVGEGPGHGVAAVAREALAWAAAQGSTIVFDPNLRPGLWDGTHAAREFAEILPLVDVLLAGREEIAALLPGKDPDHAARHLVRSGVSAVVVKDGARGAVVYEGDRVTHVPPYPVDVVVDPVGAGDAFAAGVISGLLHGWPVRMGARVGAVLGGRAITVSGDWEAARVGEDAPHLLEQYGAAVGAVEDTA
jgi:2-dehydro-3-deoxygluconokinase